VYKDPNYLNQWKLDPARQLIGSMCSGALILAALGLLQGKATTYPTSKALLEEFGIEVVEADLVTNGNVGTAAGCLAALDLVSWMLKEWIGDEVSNYVVNSVLPVTKGLVCNYGVAVPTVL
jgi:transcriptional regulator GlxA family with amidase domain